MNGSGQPSDIQARRQLAAGGQWHGPTAIIGSVDRTHRELDASGFVVLPRRWVVERSLAWMMHARRHTRDYERLIQHSETLITWAAITLMTRRLARKGATPSWPRRPASVDDQGIDVDKMIVGRERSIVIDTVDLLLAVTATSRADPSPAKPS